MPQPPKAPCGCHGEACFLQPNQGWARGQTLRSKCTAAKPDKAMGKRQAEDRWEGFFLSTGRVDLLLPECSVSPGTPSVGAEGEREASRWVTGAAAGWPDSSLKLTQGRAEQHRAAPSSVPFQHPASSSPLRSAGKERGATQRAGLHPEAPDPTHKRHVLISFQKFKSCSSTAFWHLDRQQEQGQRLDSQMSSPKPQGLKGPTP